MKVKLVWTLSVCTTGTKVTEVTETLLSSPFCPIYSEQLALLYSQLGQAQQQQLLLHCVPVAAHGKDAAIAPCDLPIQTYVMPFERAVFGFLRRHITCCLPGYM